jgi:hypothetical protein
MAFFSQRRSSARINNQVGRTLKLELLEGRCLPSVSPLPAVLHGPALHEAQHREVEHQDRAEIIHTTPAYSASPSQGKQLKDDSSKDSKQEDKGDKRDQSAASGKEKDLQRDSQDQQEKNDSSAEKEVQETGDQ